MASLADLLPLIYPHVPGAPEPLVLQQIRLSAIDWCARTRCWRYYTTVELVADELIQAPVPAYAVVHEIEHAIFNNQHITPVIYTDMVPEGWTNASRLVAFSQRELGDLRLLSVEAGTLKLSMWLKPKLGNNYAVFSGKYVDGLDEFPQHVLDNYAEQIADGALARLLGMAESWGNPGLAAYRGGLVEDRIPAAKSKSLRGQQRAPVRSKTIWM